MDGPNPHELLRGYVLGYFPMDQTGATGPMSFYEADPRAVLPIDGFRVPRSVRRALTGSPYGVYVDRAFAAVLEACATGRADGVWLTPRLADSYMQLHRSGHAHSVETWRDGELLGGLFGVALGGLFTSESMFHRAPDAGNVALVGAARILARCGFVLWDIQMASDHTRRFGAREIPPEAYRTELDRALLTRPQPFPSGLVDG